MTEQIISIGDLQPFLLSILPYLIHLGPALRNHVYARAIYDGQGSIEYKCQMILQNWQDNNPEATWDLLVERLISSGVAGLVYLAAEIQEAQARKNSEGSHIMNRAVASDPEAHTVPDTSVPATFPPGSFSPEPPAPYTPAPTTLSPGTSVPVPTAPGEPMSSPPSYTSGNATSSDSMSRPVYYPVIDKLKKSFSNLASNVLCIVNSMSPKDLKLFRTNFLLNYLKPSFPPDAPLPVIPETVGDLGLKLFLIRSWGPLQIRLLKAVVEHLASWKIESGTFEESIKKVKDELNAYEDLLKSKLPEFLSKCKSDSVSLTSHPGHSSVSVKIASKAVETSLARIIELKDFFIDQLDLPDTLFTGFCEGSIVLFFSIPTECVWSLPSCLLPSNLSLLEEWKVLFLSVKGAFTVDIKERRVVDSLDKHSLLSTLSEYKTLNVDILLRVQQMKKDLYLKEEELRVMEGEVKVLRKGKGKAVTTDQELWPVELSPYPNIKTEPSPDVKSEPSSKRFKTAGPDYLTYEPPLEKKAEAEKPPRNWREMKCQECDGLCNSIAVQGDVVCIGVNERVLLFSKTSGAQVRELGSDLIKGSVCGVALIDEDTIVVSTAKRRVRTYTTKGQLVSKFESGKYGFESRGLTVGPDGRIFVCGVVNHCICVFNVDGKLLSSFGSRGSGAGHFKGPWDVCMSGEGLLFVSDWGNSRICVHSVEGAFIREFSTPGKPTYIAATHCNHLVVSSWLSYTVVIMTTSGQLVHNFGGYGNLMVQESSAGL